MFTPGFKPPRKLVTCISDLEEKEIDSEEKSFASDDTEDEPFQPSVFGGTTTELDDGLNQLDTAHPVIDKLEEFCIKDKQFNAENKKLKFPPIAFPITSLNHMSLDCIDVQTSANFYKNVFGMKEIPRPAFEQEGIWLLSCNISIHLLQSSNVESRRIMKQQRLEYGMQNIPGCDHFAFLTSDLDLVEAQLKVYDVVHYKFISDLTGISQIFIFDPDANVVEVSNCAPLVGETTCKVKDTKEASQIDMIAGQSMNSGEDNILFYIQDNRDSHDRRDSAQKNKFFHNSEVLPSVNEKNKAEIFIDDQIDFSASDINPENKLARKLTFKDLKELIESPSSEGKTLEQLKEENRLLRQISAAFIENNLSINFQNKTAANDTLDSKLNLSQTFVRDDEINIHA